MNCCQYCKSDADGRICASCMARFSEHAEDRGDAAALAPQARACQCHGYYPACPGPMECGNTGFDWEAP